MGKITIKDKTFRPYMSGKEISLIIDEVAEKINADYEGKGEVPVILCVLNGAMVFTAELLKRLRFDCELASLKITSYCGASSTGKVQSINGVNGDIKGKKVIICEDIVDTGISMEFLLNYLPQFGPSDIKVCTFLHKPGARLRDVRLDYVGKDIPNDFIVGFGFDYDEIGRNYPDIYVLDE